MNPTDKNLVKQHAGWQLPVLLFDLLLVIVLSLYVDSSMRGQIVSLGNIFEDSSVLLPEDEKIVSEIDSVHPTQVSPTPSEIPDVVFPSAVVTIDDNNFLQDYDYKPIAQKKGTVRIPILTYHHVAALPKAGYMKPYFVTPEMFERQLKYLKEKNYRTVTSQEFYDLLMKGKNPTQKTVMLTFDDGNKDNYKYAYTLLKKYGFVGVFYVNTKRLQLTPKQLKEMADAGMSIDSHTASHLDLKKVTNNSQLISEIAGSKAVLENITKKKVVSVSYPGCTYNAQVVTIARNAGYKFGVTCSKYIDHNPNLRFGLSRMHVYNDFTNFKKRLSGYWIIP